MFLQLFKRRKKPPSQRLALAYEAAVNQLFVWATYHIRRWETQPVALRKWQLVWCLIVFLALGSLSVYYTATGHFFTRINQNQHGQQFRRK